jgi:two-component system, chemotaxis family, response regulator Rcp1
MTESSRPRILLVEDNPGDILLTRVALEETGRQFALDIARDGDEALAYMARQGSFATADRPDFVILDLNLPRRDGASVLAFIRGTTDLRDLPVAILSSAPRDALRERAASADCHIEKPADLDGFIAVGRMLWDCWDAHHPAQ